MTEIEEQIKRNSPRESKPFGKRKTIKRDLPNDKELKDVFGIVNNGCDSNQIKTFIRKTTGKEIKE